MTTMTIGIERTPRTLNIGGTAIEVEELGVRLPFARKPVDLSELGGNGQTRVYITETKELTPAEFDTFARSLLVSRDWLRGKGGGTGVVPYLPLPEIQKKAAPAPAAPSTPSTPVGGQP